MGLARQAARRARQRIAGDSSAPSRKRRMHRRCSVIRPPETLEKGKAARAAGYLAAKFGWGPYGHADRGRRRRTGRGGARRTRAGRHAAGGRRHGLERTISNERCQPARGLAKVTTRPGWRSRFSRARLTPTRRWRQAGSGQDGGRRRFARCLHGTAHDRPRRDRLRADRRRADRRDHAGARGGAVRARTRRDLREPHLYIAHRAGGVPSRPSSIPKAT